MTPKRFISYHNLCLVIGIGMSHVHIGDEAPDDLFKTLGCTRGKGLFCIETQQWIYLAPRYRLHSLFADYLWEISRTTTNLQ